MPTIIAIVYCAPWPYKFVLYGKDIKMFNQTVVEQG